MPHRRAPGRRPALRQALLPFLERSRRLERRFKWGIALVTLGLMVVSVGLSPRARYFTGVLRGQARLGASRLVGIGPDREEIDAARALARQETRRRTLEALSRFYDRTSPAMRRLFQDAGMNPKSCLIGVGRANDGFVLSPKVFEPDGPRSYRLRPGVSSVWLRQITLLEGPLGHFLVPDTPEMRRAAVEGGAIVDEDSRQTTNSWGLRGPEPDPKAEVRGIVLGDSFMQGMFNGDDHTPPLDLERALESTWGVDVSILNTGHIGYAPEQYFRTLQEYGPRFAPHFVVVSVCPNDFGDGHAVLTGEGDDWAEAGHWLGETFRWCQGNKARFLLVVVPTDRQIEGLGGEGSYAGRVSNLCRYGPNRSLNPLDEFLDEHLRLIRECTRAGRRPFHSRLYNGEIGDSHFSPLGSKLWARAVARRLDLILHPE
jgi:hypothetical protein